MAEVSSTFATRWEKHRSPWIADELDSVTLGVFGLTAGQAGDKAGKWHFLSRKLGDFCVILPISARKNEVVETEQIDQLYSMVVIVYVSSWRCMHIFRYKYVIIYIYIHLFIGGIFLSLSDVEFLIKSHSVSD